jgi:hypothetical protein
MDLEWDTHYPEIRYKMEEFYLYDSPFYAGHGTGLRCRCDSCDLVAVRYVYRYVI